MEAVLEEIERRHWDGGTALDTAHELATCIDNLIRFIYESASHRFSRRYSRTRQHCAVIALGGYGRREQAPHSDVDLLVLHSGRVTSYVETVTESLLYTLWDAKLDVGHAVRSPSECVTLAESDLTIQTSLLDGRFLIGSTELAAEFAEKVQGAVAKRDPAAFTAAKLDEMHARQKRYGDSAFLNEPNVKEGRGGLRDLHTALWIAHVHRGPTEPEDLLDDEIVTASEYDELAAAQEYLLRVRTSLHFLGRGKSDQLSYERREEIAGIYGYEATEHNPKGDVFLRDYYGHAAIIDRLSRDVIDRIAAPPERAGFLERWMGARSKVRDGVTVSAGRLVLDAEQLAAEPRLLVDVFADSQRLDVPLSSATRELLRHNAELLTAEVAGDPEVVEVFLEILQSPDNVYRTLAEMHGVGVLGRLIPEFGRLYCMVQHDCFHVYTVDEHSLIGVRELERLRQGAYADDSPFLSRVMRDCDRPDLLFLAMMFHDLGKGYGSDHDERGALMTADIGVRLHLNEDDRQTLEFLVRNHILMSTLAQNRDIQDPDLVAGFVRDVGTPRNLRLLYLLTFADMKAVGSKIWTSWKDHLLAELYQRAAGLFDKRRVFETDPVERADRTRDRVAALAADEDERGRVRAFVDAMPNPYLLALADTTILEHWRLYDSVGDADYRYGVVHVPERGFTEFTLCARDQRGLFLKVAGVLCSHGLSVLDSRLATSTDGWAIDVFRIDHRVAEEDDVADATDLSLWERVGAELSAVLDGTADVDDLVRAYLERRGSRLGDSHRRASAVSVDLDNEVSRGSTVVDVYAPDRPAILYWIALALYRQGVSVKGAKISTQLDSVLDVFYVVDADDRKIDGEDAMERLRTGLVAEIGAQTDPTRLAEASA